MLWFPHRLLADACLAASRLLAAGAMDLETEEEVMDGPHSLAYIDPASGVLALQAMIAGSLGTVVYFRRALWRVLGVILPWRNSASSASGATDESR